jgi:hypothetical protein
MKIPSYFITTLLLLVVAIVRADDITLEDGKVLHNAKIMSQDAASVTIKHSTGIARVMIPELPKELRDKLNYDPAEAKKLLEMEQANAQGARPNVAMANAEVTVPERSKSDARLSGTQTSTISHEQWEKEATQVTGTLFQVTDDGILIHLAVGGQLVFVKHADSGQFIDGDSVTILAVPCAPYRYTNTQGATKTIRAFDAAPPSR